MPCGYLVGASGCRNRRCPDAHLSDAAAAAGPDVHPTAPLMRRGPRVCTRTGTVSGVVPLPARRRGQAVRTSPSAAADAALQQQLLAQTARAMQLSDPSPSVDASYRIVSNIDASTVPERLKKECILFYTVDTEPLARKIAAQGSHVQLGNIRWRWVHTRICSGEKLI